MKDTNLFRDRELDLLAFGKIAKPIPKFLGKFDKVCSQILIISKFPGFELFSV